MTTRRARWVRKRARRRLVAWTRNYAVTDAWQLLGWSPSTTTTSTRPRRPRQRRAGAGPDLAGQPAHQGAAYGLGVRGKWRAFEVGAGRAVRQGQQRLRPQCDVPPRGPAAQIDTTRTTVRMFGQYAVQKNLSVRLDVIYDRFRPTTGPTNFTYADGTTASEPQHQQHLPGPVAHLPHVVSARSRQAAELAPLAWRQGPHGPPTSSSLKVPFAA
jgi:hypothetical protein